MIEKPKRKHGPIGRAGLVAAYLKAPGEFKTIQETDFSFWGGRKVYIRREIKN